MSHFILSKIIIASLLNVLLISLFISIFFFTYGTHVEGKVVEDQMEIVAEDVYNNVSIFGETAYNTFKEYVHNTEEPDLSKADAFVENSNKEIKKKASYAILMFIGVISVLIFAIYKLSSISGKKKYSLRNIFIHDFIILFFVGIIEFTFLQYFASKFVLIDTHKINYAIVSNLETTMAILKDLYYGIKYYYNNEYKIEPLLSLTDKSKITLAVNIVNEKYTDIK